MSQRGSGHDRQNLDQYMTPPWAVEALLRKEPIIGDVWEPAQGEGAIAQTIQAKCRMVTVVGTDLDPRFGCGTLDFLSEGSRYMMPKTWPGTIITNPPYGQGGRLALRFVEHAIELTQPIQGKVIMLLPNEWDAAGGRFHLFEDFPGFVAKYTLTKRIRWTNLPQSKNGPSQNHAWFVWDHARRGRDIGWIA